MSARVGASDGDGDHEQEQECAPGLWIRVTTDGYACVRCGETFETLAAVDEHTREKQREI